MKQDDWGNSEQGVNSAKRKGKEGKKKEEEREKKRNQIKYRQFNDLTTDCG